MNNKINNLKNEIEQTSKLRERIADAILELEKSILKSENISNWKNLQERRNLIHELKIQDANVFENRCSLLKEKREEEKRVIEEDEINILEAIKYFIEEREEEITTQEIKVYMIKASQMKNKVRYADEYFSDDTYNIDNYKKDCFNKEALCIKKGAFREHDKTEYIKDIADEIYYIHTNRKIIKEHAEAESEELRRYISYKDFYNHEIKTLKKLKVYGAILQKVYNVKF